MKQQIWSKRGMGISTLLLLILFINPAGSQAQDDQDASELDLIVWTMQSSSVAEELELKKKSQTRLTKAYLKLRNEVPTENQLETFNTNLAKFLEPEQAAQASFLLGSMNNRWDQYLGILIGFDLEEEALNQASMVVYWYMGEYLVERKKASDANTRFSGRIATSLKEKLDGEIASILSEEQYAAWSQSTARKKKVNNQ